MTEHEVTIGSRAQVYHGKAHHTQGGLTKKNLMMNKWGRIVSAKKHRTAKKEKRLEKAGYFTKKGKFGFVKKNTRKMRKSMKGGQQQQQDPDQEGGEKQQQQQQQQKNGEKE